ncbi:MAG: Fe-S cluster assembly protein IscX [Planctomycetota bacterium]|nr:Fe-S cluster assembly protein IscX [Planctomycetota bacterium]
MAQHRDTFGWLEVDRIAEALADAHPKVDPLTLRFPQLREMVQKLAAFKEEAGHPVNEKILERIQMLWLEEREDRADDTDD